MSQKLLKCGTPQHRWLPRFPKKIAGTIIMSSKPLYGVGGWLFLFVVINIIVMIADPLMLKNLIDLTEQLNPAIIDNARWNNIKTSSWVTVIIQSLLPLVMVWRLCTSFTPATITLTITFLWLSVLLYFLFSYITGLGFNWKDDARSVVPAIIWTLYFKESKRIKNTYYRVQT